MKRVLLLLATSALCGSALAKLPPLSPEAKAKADEAAAKTAWQGKVDGYKLCQAQDRVAAYYRAHVPANRPAPGPAVNTAACTDPGPFVYTPAETKPLEQAGAHSPAATAAAPPVNAPQTQAEAKTPAGPATAASAPPVATAASGVAPAASTASVAATPKR
jgi:hypothetical protein